MFNAKKVCVMDDSTINKTTNDGACSVNQNNYRQQEQISGRKDHEENSISVNLQNEELSSIEKDFQQTRVEFSRQSHCSGLDGVLAQIKFGATTITIPDDVWNRLISDSLSKGHEDTPGKNGNLAIYLCQ